MMMYYYYFQEKKATIKGEEFIFVIIGRPADLADQNKKR